MLFSAESVKKHCPNIHITVFSDRTMKSEFIDNSISIEIKHLRPKVDYIHLSPYDQTIFLDTDTIIDHDVSEMFDILEKYDLAICHDLARKRKNIAEIIPEYKEIPYSFSEVNPGVMVFSKNESVMKFFNLWRVYFHKYRDRWQYEQPTFRVALWKSSMNFYILPIEYNLRSKANRKKQENLHHEFGEDHLKPRIYHMHADPLINQGKYDVKNMEQALNYCKSNFMEY